MVPASKGEYISAPPVASDENGPLLFHQEAGEATCFGKKCEKKGQEMQPIPVELVYQARNRDEILATPYIIPRSCEHKPC